MTPSALRTALGLTQAQFAAVLGVHALTVSKWERGVLTPTPYQRALFAAFARSRKKAPGIGRTVAEVLASHGAVAALWAFLEPGFRGWR